MNAVSDVILDLTGQQPYEVIGPELRYRCFFCDNPKRKFYISSRTGQWVCFNEGISGTLKELVSKLTGKSYGVSMEWLKQHQFNDPKLLDAEREAPNDLFTQITILTNEDENDQALPSLHTLKMPAKPTDCKYLLDNFNNPEAYPYFAYCHKRGLSLGDLKKFHVSYVKHGAFLKRSGDKGHFSTSVVFFTYYNDPISHQVRPVYWNTRNINDDGIPKSLNAPARPKQFSRKEVVFNLNNAKHGQDIAIAEGVFNALTINSPKLLGIATFGKNISDQQIQLIASVAKAKFNLHNKLYICLDSDAFNVTNDIYQRLTKNGLDGSQIRIVDDRCLKLKDWNDIGRSKSLQLIKDKAFCPNNLYLKVKKML